MKKLDTEEEEKNSSSKSKKRIAIILLVLVLCAAAAFAAYFVGKKSAAKNGNSGGVTLDESASDWDEDLDSLSDKETKGTKIPGYGELTVAANSTDWKITLANPEDNECYFKYLITIDDSEDVIYESDYIEPGKAIKEFEVSEGLEAGDYKIKFMIECYSMDGENTRLNGAEVEADLHVVD